MTQTDLQQFNRLWADNYDYVAHTCSAKEIAIFVNTYPASTNMESIVHDFYDYVLSKNLVEAIQL